MAECRALDCRAPAGRRPFCRECLKTLQAGELWTLHMAFLSPMHSLGCYFPNGEMGGLAGWGDGITGGESMRVHFEEDGLPCWTTVRSARRITEVLQWLEYELAIVACAAALTARRKAKADRARLKRLHALTGRRR